jgi:putative peptidoglycan lipid II flippase
MRYLIPAGLCGLSFWKGSSVTRRILGAAVGVGFASLIVKFIAFFKEIIVAFYFGTGRPLDTFLIALALPTFGVNVLGGAIQSAFIPTYLDVLHKQGKRAARILLGSVSVAYAGLLTAVALLMLIGARWLLQGMASGFSNLELLHTRHLFYVLIPILVFTGCAKLYAALLAAEHHFTLPALAAVATPIFTMGLLLLAYGTLGIYSLAVAASAGALIEAFVLVLLMIRVGVVPSFTWSGLTPEVRQVFAQFLPLIAGTILMAGTTITDQAMAAMLPAGAVSALNYGNKLPAVTVALISGAIGTAVLPYFSRLIAAEDWSGTYNTYRTFVRFVIYATLPLAVLLIVLSPLIVRTVFEHGAFTVSAGRTVSYVQMNLLLEIPFYTVGILAVRMIAALKKTTVLVWGAAISLTLNIVLNYLLMQMFGIAGIALSTTLVYMISMIYLLSMSMRYIKRELIVVAIERQENDT